MNSKQARERTDKKARASLKIGRDCRIRITLSKHRGSPLKSLEGSSPLTPR